MTQENLPLMTWGTGGKLDYCVVATKSNIGLAVKFYGIHDGAQMKAPGSYYIGFRVRACDIADALQNAGIAFTDEHLTPTDAFPGPTWEKGDGTYASTSYGILVDADPKDGPAAFAEAMGKLDIAQAILDVAAQSGADPELRPKAEIEAYLATNIGKMVAAAKAHGVKPGASPEVKATIKDKAGIFEAENSLLAAFAKKTLEGPENGQNEA